MATRTLTDDRLAVRLHAGPDQDPPGGDDEVGDDSRGLYKVFFFIKKRRQGGRCQVQRAGAAAAGAGQVCCFFFHRFGLSVPALYSFFSRCPAGLLHCLTGTSWSARGEEEMREGGEEAAAIGEEPTVFWLLLFVRRAAVDSFFPFSFQTYHRALDVPGAAAVRALARSLYSPPRSGHCWRTAQRGCE